MKKCILTLLCSVLCVLFLCSCNSGDTQSGTHQADDIEDMLYENEKIVASTPDETGARVGQIPGFEVNGNLSAMAMPYVIKDTSLQVIAVGSYSGYYIEDGTDDYVSGISAIVVQNSGNKCIKNATVVLAGENAKEYTFVLTTLPAGTSALVLESHRNVWQEEDKIFHISAVCEEIDEPELNSDKLSISFKDGKFKLKNLTDTDFRAVYIRYKNYTAGNVYMGGVTYSATIDNVAAQGEYECESVHYFEGYSKMLMIQIIE